SSLSRRVVAGEGPAAAGASASVASAASGASPAAASSTSSFRFSGVSSAIALCLVDAALARDGQRPREVALGVAQAGGVLELAGAVLQAQAEQLAPLGRDVLAQAAIVEVAQIRRLHHWPSSRRTNLVFT